MRPQTRRARRRDAEAQVVASALPEDARARSRASRAAGYALLLFALLASILYARLEMFSQFSIYDDEGYVMLSVRSYLEGKVPYRDFLAEYGPAFYVVQGSIYRLAHLTVSHDANRFITIGLWILCAAICGEMTWAATRSRTLALAVGLATVVWLTPLIHEPGHPQGLLSVLTAGCVALVGGPRLLALDRRLMLAAFLAGVAFMMKVNVGGLQLLALTMAIALHARSALCRKVVWPILAGAAVLLPLPLMAQHLNDGALDFALLSALATLGTATSAATFRFASADEQGFSLRSISAILLVAGATIVAFCALTWAQGLSLQQLFDSLVVAQLNMGKIFYLPKSLNAGSLSSAVVSSVVAVGFAALTIAVRKGRAVSLAPLLRSAVPVLKVLVAVVGCWSFASGNLQIFAPPLLWVTMIPSGSKRWSREESLFRVFLSFVAVLEPLQAYPVAGTQIAVGSFLILPAIGLCAHDGVTAILARLGRHLAPPPGWVSRWLEPVGMAMVLLCFLAAHDPRVLLARYRANVSLDLPGAAWIRLPRSVATTYRQASRYLRENCDSFVTFPGLASFYFWTRLPPPDGWISSDWPLVLTPEQQRQVITDLERFRRRCAVYNEGIAIFWLAATPDVLPLVRDQPTSSPLAEYVRQFAGPVRKFGALEVRGPSPDAARGGS